MSERCRIVEYDGAYNCMTHNRKWGAITDPDEPCAAQDAAKPVAWRWRYRHPDKGYQSPWHYSDNEPPKDWKVERQALSLYNHHSAGETVARINPEGLQRLAEGQEAIVGPEREIPLYRRPSAGEEDVECGLCGGPASRNPHPDAGKPPLEHGYTYECVPCGVRSRRAWYERATAAERALATAIPREKVEGVVELLRWGLDDAKTSLERKRAMNAAYKILRAALDAIKESL